MKTFKENTALLDEIKKSNLLGIKVGLKNSIILLQGDRQELMSAAKFAEENSNFRFEEHEELPVGTSTVKEDIYTAEGLNLISNFSKERFLKLIELFPEVFNKKHFVAPVLNEDSSNTEEELPVKKIAIAVATAIAVGYIVYKLSSN